MTRLSLVTVVRDNPQHLQASLAVWTRQKAIAEIVVVDAGCDIPLARLGVLERPKTVLVQIGASEPWAKGLALDVGVAAATGDVVLALDCGFSLRDPKASAAMLPARPGIVSAVAPFGGQAMFARDAFLEIGGCHEFLLGDGFQDQDLCNRFENAGQPRRFFRDGEIAPIALSTGPGLASTRARKPDHGIRLALPPEIAGDPRFIGERNKLLAGMVPWSQALAAMRPRRVGTIAPRHFACHLAPRTALELRMQDLASYLAARLLFQLPEDTAIPMLASMIDDRTPMDALRANRQHQVEFAAIVARARKSA